MTHDQPTGGAGTSTRRQALTTGVLGAGVLSWLVLAGTTMAKQANSMGWFVALVVFLVCWLASRALSRDIAEGRLDEVDEYELEQRDQVRGVGYVLALVAALVLYLILWWASRAQDQSLLRQGHHLVLALFLPVAAGPSFLLAWRFRHQA